MSRTRYQRLEDALAARQKGGSHMLAILDLEQELGQAIKELLPDLMEAVQACRDAQRKMNHEPTCNCNGCSLLRRLDREVTEDTHV